MLHFEKFDHVNTLLSGVCENSIWSVRFCAEITISDFLIWVCDTSYVGHV